MKVEKVLDEYADFLPRAHDIIKKLKTLEITIKPKSPHDFDDATRLNFALDNFDIHDANAIYISNETAKTISQSFNSLLSRGAIIKNIDSEKYEKLQKENEELKIELENEKKLHHMLEGRLEEYRRRYEDGESDRFTSEVTDE